MEVMKVVIDNFVPSCGELLWADLFTNMNEVFCFLAESTIVIYIYHYNKESIVPGWLLPTLWVQGDESGARRWRPHINAWRR